MLIGRQGRKLRHITNNLPTKTRRQGRKLCHITNSLPTQTRRQGRKLRHVTNNLPTQTGGAVQNSCLCGVTILSVLISSEKKIFFLQNLT